MAMHKPALDVVCSQSLPRSDFRAIFADKGAAKKCHDGSL